MARLGSVTIGVVTAAILGLVVIAVLFGFYSSTSKTAVSSVPETSFESDFLPYEVSLTDEEQKVLDSVNAYLCAVRSINSRDFSQQNCPEGKFNEGSNSFVFGQTSTSCSDKKSSFFPVHLSGSKVDALKDLVHKSVSCWNNLLREDESVNCFEFSVGDIKGSISEDEFIEALSTSGSIGRELSGGSGIS